MTGFADRVRIKSTEETERLGLAGRVGQVLGFTTPSSTGVALIGSKSKDYAINVHFGDLDEGFWFADELVELVDHSPGTTISLDGQNKEWVRLPNGEWEERSRVNRGNFKMANAFRDAIFSKNHTYLVIPVVFVIFLYCSSSLFFEVNDEYYKHALFVLSAVYGVSSAMHILGRRL